ncbi:RNA binding (RRM/RBD/RNP motifs) family protein [Citrus sinensis]|uniref:RNA binding (RRM/RBD/RNP motifs) family protein n=1 Tax=Citrus sinensis TaxID=2711 RepID=A0ACB8IVB6_CITSI|nr:RNA binding (RRM/RBD/RNP motifs) family protein [Citrus sinensis]
MSDEGEKTCPLCAEEMDLTDQQLKPCKCGYEICVWCWHHIMDMAEKEETEGRCPACRSPYDKEKIVGMAAKCERLVAEISMERKMKSQKSKTKSSEGKKQQLSSVRVIQRNLVYIVGLPLNLGDEDLLQRREYFGQYGKVLKVSMSRTAAGVIQQFPNNTCSVYITYSKEEEAVRCIQSVHGFVLEGKSLKACFGTTKYCHAWLRNVPCTNPDCLYLHEVGSQEDSFTKDEIISAYTRSRVQQITGTTNNLQRRSGNVLPPPFDDYCHINSVSTAKPSVKNAANNPASISKDPIPNGSSARSVALPAAASWGMRASNQQSVATSACSNGPSKQRPDTVGGALAFSSAVANTPSVSTLHVDVVKRPTVHEDSQITDSKSKSDISKPSRQHFGSEPPTPNGEPASVSLSNQASCPPLSKYTDKGLNMPPNVIHSSDTTGHSCLSGPEKEENVTADVKMQGLCSDVSAMSIDRNATNEHSGVARASSALPDHGMMKLPRNQGLQPYNADLCREPLMSPETGKSITSKNDAFVSREPFDWRTDPTQAATDASPQEEEDVLSFDNQRLKDPEVVCRSNYLPKSANSLHVTNHSSSLKSNGYPEKLARNTSGPGRAVENAFLLSNEGQRMPRELQGDANINAAVDTGENSIISNILSMDFDTWDDPLALPQNLAKLLSEPEKEPSSLKMSSSWKGHNHNQSRFSFARQEESRSHTFDNERSFSGFIQQPKSHSFNQDFAGNRDPLLDKLGLRNGFHPSSFEESDNFSSNHAVFSPNKLSVAARSQISAPPGFSVPSRAPPPGFTSHERVDQSFDTLSGNHLLDSSSLLRNTYQMQPVGNVGSTGDIEFMDPAILAVGKGRLQSGLNNPGLDMRNNFPSQLNAFENEARLQLMMERSLSPHQNLRYANIGDSLSPLNDSYGISSRLMDQPQANNLSPFAQLSIQQSRNPLISNGGHWDGWNEVQGGNSLGMAELLRNERLGGFNKFYNGYEDSKFRMPSSGDIYNRTFGM